MSVRLFAALVWAAVMAMTCGAYADTDFLCMKGCASGAMTYQNCLPRCSYDVKKGGAPTAQMDIACFKQCIKNGSEAFTCLPECSKPVAAPPAMPASPAARQGPKVLETPTPYTGFIAPKRDYVSPRGSDDACMGLCTKARLQYGLCEARCRK